MKRLDGPSRQIRVKAYIGLGSNLGNREKHLEEAVDEINRLEKTRVVAVSSWFENPAVDIENGNDFLNGVVEIETSLSPRRLLGSLHEIEQKHGRVRSPQPVERNAYKNRTLDLDILLYGEETIHETDLVIPHPKIKERNFVLIPLRELGVHIPG